LPFVGLELLLEPLRVIKGVILVLHDELEVLRVGQARLAFAYPELLPRRTDRFAGIM
jgi:hypothetical protein